MSVLFLTCDVDNCNNTDEKYKLHKVPEHMEKYLLKKDIFKHSKTIDFICDKCVNQIKKDYYYA